MNQDIVAIQNKDVVLINNAGMGLGTFNKKFAPKPATIVINQKMTEFEGKKLGHLRIKETGQQFDKMVVTLLSMPTESRNYYIGKDKTPQTLMCYSRPNDGDMIQPSKFAKVPQAVYCDGCEHSSWDKWQKSKNIEDAPKCQPQYHAFLIDTIYRIPMQIFVTGGSRKPFEQGIQNLARTFAMMKSQGLNPNIFDIKFELSAKLNEKSKQYNILLANFEPIKDEERELFGSIYRDFVNNRTKAVSQTGEYVEASEEIIDAEIVNSTEGEAIEI